MFLGLLDPDPFPLVRGTDPDPSVIKEDFKMHTGSQGHGSADPDLDQHQNIIFISSLSFVAVFGSGIRDPGSGMGKNQDPGLTSRIRNTATNTGFDYG
jgi:hypothetical protein